MRDSPSSDNNSALDSNAARPSFVLSSILLMKFVTRGFRIVERCAIHTAASVDYQHDRKLLVNRNIAVDQLESLFSRSPMSSSMKSLLRSFISSSEDTLTLTRIIG